MDDILASIRRILNDDEAAKAPHDTPADDVLVLDASMMVPEPEPAPPAVIALPPPSPETAPVPPIAPPEPAPPPAQFAPSPEPALVAPAAAAAAASSVGALLRTLATERTTAIHRGGPTIEDLVREEVRPLLKEWLDTHLPPLVERLVRVEIERVMGRMAS